MQCTNIIKVVSHTVYLIGCRGRAGKEEKMAEPVKHGGSLVDTDLETTNEENAISAQQAEAASENEAAGEKPKASEEIMIEEISIDGMCGVY